MPITLKKTNSLGIMKFFLLLLFGLALKDITVNCKELSTYGSDFYIGFLRQYLPEGAIEIKVHTLETSPVYFSISSKAGYNLIGTTSASSPATITIPSSFHVRDSGYEYRNLGLHITSLPIKPITVFIIGYTKYDTPRLTHVAHPYLEQLTNLYTYYSVSASILITEWFSQVLVVGCRDNTTVSITSTQAVSLPENPQQSDSIYVQIPAGESHTVTLHELQTLLIKAPNVDLSGTKIVSNYPLTVVSGHDCARIPTEYDDCDPISTQIPPTVNWGKSFLLPPLTSRTNGQRYKIIASENNTIAEIKCGTNVKKVVVLSYDGDIHQFDTNSNEYCTVLTSNPSYVAEYGFGRDYLNDGYGDPLLMTIPPLDQYIHSVTFSSFVTIPKNYFSILIPNDQYFHQTYLYNGFTLTPIWTTINYPNGSIAGYGYSTQFSGAVTISHSNVNGSIFVTVYGFVESGAYGYTAGMKLNPLNIDVDLPEISFTKQEYYVGEGDGVVVVVLERYEGITWSVSVIIKTLSSQVATASEGVDYISINKVVNFQSGETLKNVTITILDDSYIEGTEYFILEIESIEEVVTFSIRETAVAIQDNDVVRIGFTANSSVVTSNGETTFTIGILSGQLQFGASVRVMLTAVGPIKDEVPVCTVEFNYYAENYTIETNVSHIISAESHTEAASWIVQLSSDSPDIIILLEPDQVHLKPGEEPSSAQLSSLICDSQGVSPYTADSQGIFPSRAASLTSDSQCIPAYSLYVVAAIVLFAVVFALVVVFVVLYRRHIPPRCHYQPQDNNDDAAFPLGVNYLPREDQESLSATSN